MAVGRGQEEMAQRRHLEGSVAAGVGATLGGVDGKPVVAQFTVAEVRSAVAIAAAALADEDAYAPLGSLGVDPGTDRLALGERIAKPVEGRGRRLEGFDECGQRLADIRED